MVLGGGRGADDDNGYKVDLVTALVRRTLPEAA